MRKLFTRVVVATDEEYEKAKSLFPNYKIIQTGVGALNVYEKLRRVPRWFHIINWGYAGSNSLHKGFTYQVSTSYLYHPNVDYLEPGYSLITTDGYSEGVPCYTSCDFVTSTDIKDPCLFDMELVYICAMGFKKVSAVKVVSDSLNLEEYEKSVGLF
jgi:hypothetical protein